jgi:nucleotide-binding universal stress UspA family protein
MIERILLLVTDTPGMARTSAWVLRFARAMSARILAVSVVGSAEPPPDEERAWELLYEIEDDAFEQNVKVSLLLEQGEVLERLLTLGTNYDVELIVTSADSRLNQADLVRRSQRPVLFVK